MRMLALLFALSGTALAQTSAGHLEALREKIRGREQLPAREVFENVQLLGAVPAGRLLSIMEIGYSRSLGVGCDHCHTPGEWADDGKVAKEIAREMSTLTRKLNAELLPAIAPLAERKPVVNCTTCHRGSVEPALDLAPEESPSD